MSELFEKLCIDIIDYIKENEEDLIETLDDLNNLNVNDNYYEIKEEILSIFSQTFHGYEDDAEDLYGNFNLDFYLKNFNYDFYKYLSKFLKNQESKTCKKYSKHIKSILKAKKSKEESIKTSTKKKVDSNKLSTNKVLDILKKSKNHKVEIKYKDNYDNISDRIISNIVIDEYRITAFCHLRNDERNFKINSIIEAKIIK